MDESVPQFSRYYRLWPSDPRPEKLYHALTCPPHTDITVERDPMLGKLLGYHEVAQLSSIVPPASVHFPSLLSVSPPRIFFSMGTGGTVHCWADPKELYLSPASSWPTHSLSERRCN